MGSGLAVAALCLAGCAKAAPESEFAWQTQAERRAWKSDAAAYKGDIASSDPDADVSVADADAEAATDVAEPGDDVDAAALDIAEVAPADGAELDAADVEPADLKAIDSDMPDVGPDASVLDSQETADDAAAQDDTAAQDDAADAAGSSQDSEVGDDSATASDAAQGAADTAPGDAGEADTLGDVSSAPSGFTLRVAALRYTGSGDSWTVTAVACVSQVAGAVQGGAGLDAVFGWVAFALGWGNG